MKYLIILRLNRTLHKFSSNCKNVNNTVYRIGTFIVMNIAEPDIQFGEIIIFKKLLNMKNLEGVQK